MSARLVRAILLVGVEILALIPEDYPEDYVDGYLHMACMREIEEDPHAVDGVLSYHTCLTSEDRPPGWDDDVCVYHPYEWDGVIMSDAIEAAGLEPWVVCLDSGFEEVPPQC